MSAPPSRHQRQLDALLLLPGNTHCADCNAPAPRWASTNLGIFLCLSCASVHRSLGTHTSRVKSVTMDNWSRDAVDFMRAWGNTRANGVWLGSGDGVVPIEREGGRRGEMEAFIRDKYERGLFRADRGERAEPQRAGRANVDDGSRSRSSSRPQPNDSSALDPQPRSTQFRDEPLRDYAYNGHAGGGPPSSSGKKAATRNHIDSNWADLLSSPATTTTTTHPSLENDERPSSSGGRKAGRLLGMHVPEEGGGGVRLPPVTRAPKGLVYRREGDLPPPPPQQKQKQEPQSQPQPQQQPQSQQQPAQLIDLANSTPVPAPYIVTPQPQPMPYQQIPSVNPFLGGGAQFVAGGGGGLYPYPQNQNQFPNQNQIQFQQQQIPTPMPSSLPIHTTSPFPLSFPLQHQQQQPTYPFPASAPYQQGTGNPFYAYGQGQNGMGGWSR